MKDNRELFQKDIDELIAGSDLKWEQLRGARLLITGATGIIGYALVNLLLCADSQLELGMNLFILTRDEKNARELFSVGQDNRNTLHFIVGDINEFREFPEVDYIIHGAAITSSKDFVNRPVETISTSVEGTKRVLEAAKNNKIRKMIFLSTMEVYGHPQKGHRVKEDEIGTFSPVTIRNSYPISKLMSELMCLAYDSEYNVPVDILRLTQTLGPIIKDTDARFFAYLVNCIRSRKDIVLKTEGKTERSYLYSLDAATSIIYVLLGDKHGEIYNVSNENLYCSISEFAKRIGAKYDTEVTFDFDGGGKSEGFADTLYLNLDTEKIERLGWSPSDLSLEEIFDRMV